MQYLKMQYTTKSFASENCYKKMRNQRLTFNIAGEIYETYQTTLSRFPETLLGSLDTLAPYYSTKSNEYFFDRNRQCFESILHFYQSYGTLSCPQGVQFPIFEEECRYFNIAEEFINESKKKEGIIFGLDKEKEPLGKLPLKAKIWNILEKPDSSRMAWVFAVFSLIMVVISIIVAIIETDESFQNEAIMFYIELVLNVWFLIELILRFIFCSSKLSFIRGVLNWIDACAVTPFFMSLILKTKGSDGLMGVFKTLKFLRVIRLFRLSKHSRRLKVVAIILKSCVPNFKLLAMCATVVIFLGGSFIYFIEKNHYYRDFDFHSIPQGFWWGLVTITSVGYGDVVPVTIPGRLFAACFMIFGVMTISVPVLTIVSKFTTIYPRNVECETHIKEYE